MFHSLLGTKSAFSVSSGRPPFPDGIETSSLMLLDWTLREYWVEIEHHLNPVITQADGSESTSKKERTEVALTMTIRCRPRGTKNQAWGKKSHRQTQRKSKVRASTKGFPITLSSPCMMILSKISLCKKYTDIQTLNHPIQAKCYKPKSDKTPNA